MEKIYFLYETMFINFRKVFEYLFSSFDIAGDTKYIEKCREEWIRFIMVVKRHWIYAIYNSWKVLFVIVIWFFNIYLLALSPGYHDVYSYGIALFLWINITYWVIIIVLYIIEFYRVHWSQPLLEDIHSALRKSQASDEIFTKFFNHTIFILVVLFAIFAFTTITGIISVIGSFTSESATNFWVNIWNSLLLLVQIMLFYSFMQNMINQEMDYKVVIPGQILYFDQTGVLGNSQNMNSNKIKTINTQYPSILASFFNYGNVLVLSEWDQKDKWEMQMEYVGNPPNTVKEIEKVLRNDLTVMEKEVNLLLKRFKEKIWYDTIETKEQKEALKKFITENEEMLEDIFTTWNKETQDEVRELFTLMND